jgi:hypothetical protein
MASRYVHTTIPTRMKLMLYSENDGILSVPSLSKSSGPPCLPFFGCALQMGLLARKFKHFRVFEEFSKRYGSVIGLQAGLQYIGKHTCIRKLE